MKCSAGRFGWIGIEVAAEVGKMAKQNAVLLAITWRGEGSMKSAATAGRCRPSAPASGAAPIDKIEVQPDPVAPGLEGVGELGVGQRNSAPIRLKQIGAR